MAEKKTSAFYMKRMRDRLTAAGYVKHEAWVLPENKAKFIELEKRLRQPIGSGVFNLEEYMTAPDNWTIGRLYEALSALDLVTHKEASITLAGGAEQSIKLDMHEHGDLPLFIAVVGEQIIVDTLLVEASGIKDLAAFNEAVLRSRSLFPLSSIGIETMPDGQVMYSMFGSLSAGSSISNVVTEIHTLVDNVHRATDAFGHFFH